MRFVAPGGDAAAVLEAGLAAVLAAAPTGADTVADDGGDGGDAGDALAELPADPPEGVADLAPRSVTEQASDEPIASSSSAV